MTIDPPFSCCWQMTYRDYLAMVTMRNRGYALIPSLTVMVLGDFPGPGRLRDRMMR